MERRGIIGTALAALAALAMPVARREDVADVRVDGETVTPHAPPPAPSWPGLDARGVSWAAPAFSPVRRPGRGWTRAGRVGRLPMAGGKGGVRKRKRKHARRACGWKSQAGPKPKRLRKRDSRVAKVEARLEAGRLPPRSWAGWAHRPLLWRYSALRRGRARPARRAGGAAP